MLPVRPSWQHKHSLDVNVLWLQKLWPLLRNSGPLIARLAESYVKRGADRKTAENIASTAVILDQVLEERLKEVPTIEDLDKLRQELSQLRSLLQSQGLPRRPLILWYLLLGQWIIIALLLYFGIHS